MKLRSVAGTVTAVLLFTAAILTANSSRAASQSVNPLDDGSGVVLGPEAAAPQPQLAPDPPLAGTGVVHFGAEAFQAYSQSATWTRNNTLMLYATGAGNQVFDAPVLLPNGVSVKQVVIYYYDNEPNADAGFYWVTLATNSAGGLSTPYAFTIGASGNIRYIVLNNFPNPIDNGSNNYFLRASLPGGAAVALHSVRIDYSYTAALP